MYALGRFFHHDFRVSMTFYASNIFQKAIFIKGSGLERKKLLPGETDLLPWVFSCRAQNLSTEEVNTILLELKMFLYHFRFDMRSQFFFIKSLIYNSFELIL